jgi:hypothetical protein
MSKICPVCGSLYTDNTEKCNRTIRGHKCRDVPLVPYAGLFSGIFEGSQEELDEKYNLPEGKT